LSIPCLVEEEGEREKSNEDSLRHLHSGMHRVSFDTALVPPNEHLVLTTEAGS
jgi:hypothetical protein